MIIIPRVDTDGNYSDENSHTDEREEHLYSLDRIP